MFNFFKKRAKKSRNSTVDFYELSEQETDMLMGGSPVRSLLMGGPTPSPWQPSGEGNYSSTVLSSFSTRPWQQTPNWIQNLESGSPNGYYPQGQYYNNNEY